MSTTSLCAIFVTDWTKGINVTPYSKYIHGILIDYLALRTPWNQLGIHEKIDLWKGFAERVRFGLLVWVCLLGVMKKVSIWQTRNKPNTIIDEKFCLWLSHNEKENSIFHHITHTRPMGFSTPHRAGSKALWKEPNPMRWERDVATPCASYQHHQPNENRVDTTIFGFPPETCRCYA